MTASVSSDCTDSFCVVRSWNSLRTHSCSSGARHDLVAARDLDDLEPARPLVVGPHGRERGVDVLLRLAVEQLVERLRRDRLGRREDQGFDDGFEMVGHVTRLPFVRRRLRSQRLGRFVACAATSSA